jgi:hypothetical protein
MVYCTHISTELLYECIHIVAAQLVSYWRELQAEQLKTEGGSSRWKEHCESLWLWDGDSSGTQEGEYSPLEAGTRGLVCDSRARRRSACYHEL